MTPYHNYERITVTLLEVRRDADDAWLVEDDAGTRYLTNVVAFTNVSHPDADETTAGDRLIVCRGCCTPVESDDPSA